MNVDIGHPSKAFFDPDGDLQISYCGGPWLVARRAADSDWGAMLLGDRFRTPTVIQDRHARDLLGWPRV